MAILCYSGYGCLGCSFCDGGREPLRVEEKKELRVTLKEILEAKKWVANGFKVKRKE